jgi:hypothetical protein
MLVPRRLWMPLTPVVIAVTRVVFLWANNAGEVDPVVVMPPLGLAAGLAVVAWIAARMMLHSESGAAIFASGLLILFFGYGYAVQFLISAGLELNQADLLIALLCGFLIVVGAYATNRLELDRLVLGLAVAAGSLLVMSGVELARQGVALRGSAGSEVAVKRFAPSDPGQPAAPLHLNSPVTPYIYFIVLDGYARDDVLRTGFSHDNTRFLEDLEDRGFYVARESDTNYVHTYLSLPSSLNGVYMAEFIDQYGSTQKNLFYRLVRNNWVGRFLRAHGYRYAQIFTNWGGTETSEISDLDYRFVPRWMGSEFAYVLLGTTALHRLRPTVADFHLFGLDAIKQVSDLEGPTFLLAHVLLPHDPFVFERDGTVRAEVPLHRRRRASTKRRAAGSDPAVSYANQLVFLNSVILEVIDHVLDHSSVQPIIIIQGDHGWNSPPPPSLSPAMRRIHRLRSRAGILNALRVPEAVERRLYPSISPVNTFRLLFAELFGADLDLLPDRTYKALPGRQRKIEDVTELVRPSPQ